MAIIRIPLSGVSQELRNQIESLLPEPMVVPGWKFVGYKWRKLSQINTKDKSGNTDNSVRVSGTGDNEILEISLRKGLDTSCLTPSIYPEDNLINGFNRLKQLKSIGYKEWIFAQYERDLSTQTEFQETFSDALDDIRASTNKGFGQKVITDSEIEEIGRKRFEHRKDKSKEKVKAWIETLDLNLSPQKVEGLGKKISLDFVRRGNIESFNRSEALEFLDDLGIGADLLNTYGMGADGADPTRMLRLMWQIMKNFIDNNDTMDIALFDSQASSHAELDENRKNSVKMLKEIDKIIMAYAGARIANHEVKPWSIIGSVPQAQGRESIADCKSNKTLIEL